MFKKSLMLLGVVVLCLKMMIGNAGSSDDAVIPLTETEMLKFKDYLNQKFERYGLDYTDLKGFKSEDEKNFKFVAFIQKGNAKRKYVLCRSEGPNGSISESFSGTRAKGDGHSSVHSASHSSVYRW